MKNCCDYVYLDANSTKKGKIRCTNSRSAYSEVSARMLVCSNLLECLQSRRPECDCGSLMDISRRNSYYVVSAVSEILGLGENNIFLTAFSYVKDEIIPYLENGANWIKEYDTVGPKIAAALQKSEDKISLASEILDRCLIPFLDLVRENQFEEAIYRYTEMLHQLSVKFNLTLKPKVLALKPKPTV